ncbi:hypothetical protein BV22DRAFT_1035849 [Leucogyrophana mollusca]|uniref:Uncharacterized protein n=1 Tax=Leucogyrophana mollusca TaxID=85980 RepID=A0ACB8BFB3_9AGAM|nr:hypothetical protein BV22DRAFT_1035849 [Leucogyrophana mollusca]
MLPPLIISRRTFISSRPPTPSGPKPPAAALFKCSELLGSKVLTFVFAPQSGSVVSPGLHDCGRLNTVIAILNSVMDVVGMGVRRYASEYLRSRCPGRLQGEGSRVDRVGNKVRRDGITDIECSSRIVDLQATLIIPGAPSSHRRNEGYHFTNCREDEFVSSSSHIWVRPAISQCLVGGIPSHPRLL